MSNSTYLLKYLLTQFQSNFCLRFASASGILDLNFWVYAEILFKITCLLYSWNSKSRKIHLLALITQVRRVHSLIQGRRNWGCERAFALSLIFPGIEAKPSPSKGLNPPPPPSSYGPVMLIHRTKYKKRKILTRRITQPFNLLGCICNFDRFTMVQKYCGTTKQ